MATTVHDEKPKRGRPRLLMPEYEAELWNLYPPTGVKSTRGIQNKHYLCHAVGLVKDDPRFAWIVDAKTDRVRSTILTELGRIEDDDDLLEMALLICESRASTRKAVAAIRQFRDVAKGPSCLSLTSRLITTIKAYVVEHPGTT